MQATEEYQAFAVLAHRLFWGKPLVLDKSFGSHLIAPNFYPDGDLLIRDEYIEIFLSITASLDLNRRRTGGRVICGQPGSGRLIPLEPASARPSLIGLIHYLQGRRRFSILLSHLPCPRSALSRGASIPNEGTTLPRQAW